jgi:hypothetical protein
MDCWMGSTKEKAQEISFLDIFGNLKYSKSVYPNGHAGGQKTCRMASSSQT